MSPKVNSIFGLLLFLLVIFIYTLFVTSIEMDTLKCMGIFGITLFVLSGLTWWYNGNDLISPYFFFLIALYLFSYGQSLMYAFNWISAKRDLIGFQGISIYQIYEAQKATLYMLGFFHIGALCVNKINCKSNRELISGEDELQNEATLFFIRRIGLILFVVSFIPYFYMLINNMMLSMSYGYGALYAEEGTVGISQIGRYIGDYCVPSAICLFIGYKDQKRVRFIVYFICLLIIVITLLTGYRTYGVVLALLLILLRHLVVKKISRKEFGILCIVGLSFLSLLSLIGNMRTSKSRNMDAYISSNNNQNAAIEAIAEMGGSMFCLIKTQNIVPESENYRYGKSYIYSFTTIIPNLGFWEMHPARKEANLGDWLTKKLHLNYGTGYSMCAEAYINFGSIAWLMMFLLGMAFCKLLEVGSLAGLRANIPMLVFSLILFWFCLKLPRNSFISFIRSFVYYAFPIYLYIKIMSKRSLAKY